jgi:hypothetical protein
MNSPHGWRYQQVPLWRNLNRYLLEGELAVRQFSRNHKYSFGRELRRQVMAIFGLVPRAVLWPSEHIGETR